MIYRATRTHTRHVKVASAAETALKPAAFPRASIAPLAQSRPLWRLRRLISSALFLLLHRLLDGRSGHVATGFTRFLMRLL